jgi:hypothetical protein
MNLIFSYNYLSTEINVEDLKYSKPSSNAGDALFESVLFDESALDKLNFHTTNEHAGARRCKVKKIIIRKNKILNML